MTGGRESLNIRNGVNTVLLRRKGGMSGMRGNLLSEQCTNTEFVEDASTKRQYRNTSHGLRRAMTIGTGGQTYSSVPPTTERMATTRESPRCEGTSMVAAAAFGLATALFTFGVLVA